MALLTKDDIICGDLAKAINDFEDAHPEMDAGWFNDIISAIIDAALKGTQ